MTCQANEQTHRFEQSVVEEPFEVWRGGAAGRALQPQRGAGPDDLEAALEKRVRLHKRSGIWRGERIIQCCVVHMFARLDPDQALFGWIWP